MDVDKEKIFKHRLILFLALAFLMLLVSVALILGVHIKHGKPEGLNKHSGLTPAMMREYASKLQSQGLTKHALH